MKVDLSRTSFGLQWSPKGLSFAVPVSHDVCRAPCADANLHIRTPSILNLQENSKKVGYQCNDRG